MTMFNVGTVYYVEYRSNNEFNELGKNLTFSADIYSNYACRLYIYYYTTQYIQRYVDVPINAWGTYSINLSIPENASSVLYRVEPRDYAHEDAVVYTDNWVLTVDD